MIFGAVLIVIGLAMLLAIRFDRLTVGLRGGAVVVFGWGVITIVAELFDLW